MKFDRNEWNGSITIYYSKEFLLKQIITYAVNRQLNCITFMKKYLEGTCHIQECNKCFDAKFNTIRSLAQCLAYACIIQKVKLKTQSKPPISQLLQEFNIFLTQVFEKTFSEINLFKSTLQIVIHILLSCWKPFVNNLDILNLILIYIL